MSRPLTRLLEWGELRESYGFSLLGGLLCGIAAEFCRRDGGLSTADTVADGGPDGAEEDGDFKP